MFSVNMNGRKVNTDLDLYYRNEAGEFVPTEELEVTSNDGSMTFGDALEALKGGKKVARKGWNGKGMFLFLAPGSDLTNCICSEGMPPCVDSVCMKTAQETIVVGWLASQTDMLADDWEIVE